MEDKKEEKRVCVTGASGYIASWIVKMLLDRGYVVHATVRSLNNPKKTDHLRALEGAETRLRLFEANLLEEGSFDSAIQGCCGVFHTASPVLTSTPNPQEDLIDPAVKGTENVFATCAKSKSVKRVIFTSSTATVVRCGRPLTPETVVDETWFSTLDGCKGGDLEGYLVSKTLAEAAAWRIAKEKGFEMVSINPAFVIGPMLQSEFNTSSQTIYNLVNGQSDTYWNTTSGMVHVRDVAETHIKAFEVPSANGRYILSESVVHFTTIIDILRELYPNLKFPNKSADDLPMPPTYKLSGDKVKSLGIEYIPLKDMLKETVDFLIQKKLISA